MQRFFKPLHILCFLAFILASVLLTACSDTHSRSELLNPSKPITVTLWHYYNGSAKEAFDALVSEFNDTVGMSEGIVVDAQSQGDIDQLGAAVFDAANASIGAIPMPNIFASYPDNAFRVNQIEPLVSLDQYFSETELSAYRTEFLEEGRFITDDLYYILPIAKSSENLYINSQLWTPFADANSLKTDDLSTWEGLRRVSELYYAQTGKSFFSLDAIANYIIVTAMTFGDELYTYYPDGTASFHMSDTVARTIWDDFYTPYLEQVYLKTGRFSSDDAKTGAVVSYTGSTAGAAYFPTSMVINDVTFEVSPIVLPYPHYMGMPSISIQQGAGMCISKSDSAHEYASAVFLKWFTEPEQNIRFAVSTGYFPVTIEALSQETLNGEADALSITNEAIRGSIIASDEMFKTNKLYNTKPFDGSYDMRIFLGNTLQDKINKDLEWLDSEVAKGESRDALVQTLTSDAAFNQWALELNQQAMQLLNSSR